MISLGLTLCIVSWLACLLGEGGVVLCGAADKVRESMGLGSCFIQGDLDAYIESKLIDCCLWGGDGEL